MGLEVRNTELHVVSMLKGAPAMSHRCS